MGCQGCKLQLNILHHKKSEKKGKKTETKETGSKGDGKEVKRKQETTKIWEMGPTQWVKLVVPVYGCSALIQLSANAPGTAAEGSTNAWQIRK